jgi:peptide/nickel transport system permease protein
LLSQLFAQGRAIVVGFLANRILYSGAVMAAVITAIFVLVHLGGDPTAGFTSPDASPAQRQLIREQFGLDRPLPLQYAEYLAHAVRGDFGESWRARQPAMEHALERLPATLRLTAVAMAIALAIGLPLGVIAGQRPGGGRDALVSSVALAGQAVPGFLLGTVLILIFAVRLRWLPSSGGEGMRSLLLPAITLAMYPAAIIARLIRGSLIDALRGDYVRTAYAKGLDARTVLFGHALRNATLPALAYIGLQVGFLIGGAVVVEGVFAYPGIGSLALTAVADRDLPVIQAVALIVALLVVSVNLLIDVAARAIDPRLRTAAVGAG